MNTYNPFSRSYMLIFKSVYSVEIDITKIRKGYNELNNIFKADYLVESYYYLGFDNRANFTLSKFMLCKNHSTFFVSFVPEGKLLKEFSNNVVLLGGVRYSVVGSKPTPIDTPNVAAECIFPDYKWCKNYFQDSRQLQLDHTMLQVSILVLKNIILPLDLIECLVGRIRDALPGVTQYNLQNLDSQAVVCEDKYMIHLERGTIFLVIYNLGKFEYHHKIRMILAETPYVLRRILTLQTLLAEE